MNYTGIVDGYQIRDVVYIGLPPKDTPPRYDIVRWKDCELPQTVRDLMTGEVKTMTRYCYSVATLEWDKDGWWQFKSVGTRWLEENPPKAVVDMVLKFCEEKAREIEDESAD